LSTEIRIHSKTRRFVLGSRPSRQSQLTATIQKAKNRSSKEKSPDFAFVIHALSKEDLFRVPGLKPLSKLPEGVINAIEKTATKQTGVAYGYANHFSSKKNHREYYGVTYGLPATPKMLLNEDREVTYRKIDNLCHHDAHMGAKI